MDQSRDTARAAEPTVGDAEQPHLQSSPPEAEATEKTGRGRLRATAGVVRGWKRWAFLCFGGIFFVLGMLGAFLPGIPATPFLLLTSYFLVRSSPKLNSRLLRSRLFGPILIDWQEHGGVRRDIKIKAIVVVVIVVALTIFLTGYSWIATIVVISLAAAGVGVILRLPTIRDA